MRIGMQTWGSDGDIRPMLALGGGLVKRGHRVRIAVGSVDGKDYTALSDRLGIEYLPIHAEFRIPASQMFAACGKNPGVLRMVRMLLNDFFFPSLAPMGEAARALADDSELLVGHMMAWPLHATAILRRKPYASVAYWPGLIPDDRRPPEGLPGLGRWLNGLLWKLAERAIDWAVGPRLGAFWDEHALPRRHAIPDTMYSRQLCLVASSPALYPGLGDWDHYRFCGQLQVPHEAEPGLPAELEAFLAAGGAPAFLGMGSGAQIDADACEAFLLQVADKLDRRSIVQLAPGRAPPMESSDRICFVHHVAHGPLFPRCAAVMHHGGAGTTHSALAAGRPAVVVSFMDEQTAWGKQLVRAGAGGGVFRYGKVSAERVATTLRATMDSAAMRASAEKLAATMQLDGGVETAATHLEALASAHRS
jgi:sterol 3beta-glucosyltransferase